MQSRHCFHAALLLACPLAVVACSGEDLAGPTTGTIEVTTETSGANPDSDGYAVTLDDGAAEPIGLNGRVTLTPIAAGAHTLVLSELAANCSVEDPNPRAVPVSAGDTTRVSLEVTCLATTGSLLVSVTTSDYVDPDGYTVLIDNSEPGLAIAINDTIIVTQIPGGEHTVTLTGVAPNCTVTGEPSPRVMVASRTRSDVAFAVSCGPPAALLEVNTTTTGTSLGLSGYKVVMYGAHAVPMGQNATTTVSLPFPGFQSVGLIGLPENCAVQGDNPVILTLVANQRATVSFAIFCRTAVPAAWAPIASGTPNWLSHLSGTSAANVFAVGNGGMDDCIIFCGRMSILHYDGMKWSTQLEGIGWARDVWAAPAGKAFAIAGGAPSFPGPFLHYDGTQWSAMASPDFNVGLEDVGFTRLWGTSGDDVFAVGAGWSGFTKKPVIAHYDGVSWSRMEVPYVDGLWLTDVWGSSSHDVYAVGRVHDDPDYHGDPGVVLHYDGQQWSKVFGERYLGLSRVWGSSPTDVYFTGVTVLPTEDGSDEMGGQGAIVHFDGATWSELPSPSGSPLGPVWGSSPSDLYILGSWGSTSIWHFNGQDWKQLDIGTPFLTDIRGSSANDILVVGRNGTILHGP